MAKTMLGNLQAIVQNTLTDSIKMIDIDELHESADNFFVVDRVEEFADTILGQGGVKDNLIVRPMESGGYEIISGHRRRAAVQHLLDRGENISRYLPCLVQNYSDDDARLLDIVLMNVSARQISDTEMWQSYELLDRILKAKQNKGERFGKIRNKLAEILGVSSSQVGKLENISHNAIPAVTEALQTGDISISTANEIARLSADEQETLINQGIENISHKDIRKKNLADRKQKRHADEKSEGDIYSTQEPDADEQSEGDIYSTQEPDADEQSEGDIYSTQEPDADEQSEGDIYSTQEPDADEQSEGDIYSTQEPDADEQSEGDIYSTQEPDADEQSKGDIYSTQEPDADEQSEGDIYSTNPITEKLTHFIHEHYYDLETIFTTYTSMADDEEEIKLLEDFQELLRQSKEAERNKVRFGL